MDRLIEIIACCIIVLLVGSDGSDGVGDGAAHLIGTDPCDKLQSRIGIFGDSTDTPYAVCHIVIPLTRDTGQESESRGQCVVEFDIGSVVFTEVLYRNGIVDNPACRWVAEVYRFSGNKVCLAHIIFPPILLSLTIFIGVGAWVGVVGRIPC